MCVSVSKRERVCVCVGSHVYLSYGHDLNVLNVGSPYYQKIINPVGRLSGFTSIKLRNTCLFVNLFIIRAIVILHQRLT